MRSKVFLAQKKFNVVTDRAEKMARDKNVTSTFFLMDTEFLYHGHSNLIAYSQ